MFNWKDDIYTDSSYPLCFGKWENTVPVHIEAAPQFLNIYLLDIVIYYLISKYYTVLTSRLAFAASDTS
jgi:hypothetical protein